MTLLLTQFWKTPARWIRQAVGMALLAGMAVPAQAQGRFGDGFGVSPDDFFGRADSAHGGRDVPRVLPVSGLDRSRPWENRIQEFEPTGNRYDAPLRRDFDQMLDDFGRSDRDVRFDDRAPLGRDDYGRRDSRARGRGYGADQDGWDLTRRSPRDPAGFDDFPTSRSRIPYDQGPQLGPLAPAAPRPSTLQPSIEQKIARRYEDPRVLRVLQSLSPQSGEAFYMEVAQLIDGRHIEPTSYAQRTQAALRQVSIAVDTPSFQRAVGLRAGMANTQQFQQALQQMQSQSNVNSAGEAIGVMRQTGAAANQLLGISPAAISLEFVYASLETLDQYSMFVPPEKSGSPSVGLENNIVGIGVELETHPQGLMILKVLSGGPAAQATLRRGDIITAVNGRSTMGLDLGQAVDMITGPEGTNVPLSIRRDGMIGDTVLTRQRVTIYSVAEVRMEDPANRVGYIKIDKFAESTQQELDAALWQLHQQGMQSLVVDVRGNPGGLLTTAISVSNTFLPRGTIVSTRGRTQADNSQEQARGGQTWKVPMAVLVDHNSASASEIFAAAIQENGRGVIVGETTYGKGTVQTLFPIQSVGSGLRLTTARFYSPRGVAMAGVGVTPDVPVPQVRNDVSTQDRALQTAVGIASDPRTKSLADGVARTGQLEGATRS